jgi:predicted  nucleic acid-binding Zn-ribbon protein
VNDSDEHDPKLNHFHVCVHCGSAFRREEYVGRAITSGIYHCPKCGLDGPLNVEVREIEAPDGSKNNSPDTDSSGQR